MLLCLFALQEAHPELVAQTARAAADIVSRRLNPQSGAAVPGMPAAGMAAAGAQIQQLGALGGLSAAAPQPPASGPSGSGLRAAESVNMNASAKHAHIHTSLQALLHCPLCCRTFV